MNFYVYVINKDIKDTWEIKEELTIGNGFEICPYAFLNNNKKDFSDINYILKSNDGDSRLLNILTESWIS